MLSRHWRDPYGSGYDAETDWQNRSVLLALLRGRVSHCRTIARGAVAPARRRDYRRQNFLLGALGTPIRDYGIFRRWAERSLFKFSRRGMGG
jgi:hypothetical protein